MTVSVLGLPVRNVTMEEAVADISAFFEKRESKMVVTPNLEILQALEKDASVRDCMASADYVVPDGIGVVMIAKKLGTPVKEKVAGVELAAHLLEVAAAKGKRVYFLGGKPGVAALAKKNLEEKYPAIQIVGLRDGYFKPEDEPAIIEEINALNVDMLFVCLGAPKQEKWMSSHKDQLKLGVMLGLGGTLDILAGTVTRAPRWMITCRIEWLHRLIKEPWRFKRMMSLPFFYLKVRK